MTTASKITLARIALIPVFFIIAVADFAGHLWVALAIFALASLTDGIDGYVARHYNQVSDFGKFLDPIADKMLVMAALVLFVAWGQMPAWALLVILVREFGVSALRLIAVEGGTVIAAGWSGKIKTAATLVGIMLMLTPWHAAGVFGTVTVDTLCIAVMVITTVWSGVEYFIRNWKVFKLD